jgi:hypothetical protein
MIEPIREMHVARIDDLWRLQIAHRGSKWEVRLIKRGSKAQTIVGEWGNFEEAKAQSVPKAREILARRGVTIGPLDWQERFVPSPTFETQLRRNRDRYRTVLGIASGLIAVGAAILLSFPQSGLFSQSRTNEIEIATLKAQTAEQNAELAALRAAIAKGGTSTQVPQVVATLQTDVTSLRSKMADYEAAVGDEPAKRLAVPLLRKDMDTLKEEHKTDLNALHEEVSRTFDTMKWLLGLLGFTNLAALVPGWLSRKTKDA